MDYLKGLNEKQKETVLQKDGPLLVLAGAGSGKTKTITHRIFHLVSEGVLPHQILAITFTNKAAKEMRERVFGLLKKLPGALPTGPVGASDEISKNFQKDEIPFVSTFHSLGVRIIKENSAELNISRYFTILDKADSQKIIKDILKELDIDPKQFEPSKILGIISKEKGGLVTAEAYSERAAGFHSYSINKIVSTVWPLYEKRLEKEKSLDFDDLLLKTYKLLRKNKEILEHYQNLWQYIHIDEYQDTNKAQYELVRLLASKNRNLCAVGDIDQNIYGWRGADIQNILNFEKNYPDAKAIILEENYRSTQTILAVANGIIEKNKMRRKKNLFTKNQEGEKVALFEAHNENEEARFIAEKVKGLIADGTAPKDIAILYRANFQSRVIEGAFLDLNLPYQLLGVKFFERKEVKDTLSYLRAALNRDSASDIKRIINFPTRGIGKITIDKIFSGQEASLSQSVKIKLLNFYALLDKIKESVLSKKPSELLRFIITESGIENELISGGDDDKERLENTMELVTLAKKYDYLPYGEGVEKLIEESALSTDQDSLETESGAVKMMTVHASKGLEFDNVFVAGMEEDLFPHQRIGGGKRSAEESEEERRLFYVAITRAKKKLFLSYARTRTIFGSLQLNSPSQFISDIDPEFIEEEKSFEYREKIIYMEL
ncbi:MAG: UvrD-helicase domain-containing protein [Patescibacteria group bacterium]